MENLLEKPVENLNPYELDSLSSVPLYSQIVRFFLVAISAGELRVGEKLPTEKKICEQFGVSRITARRAVSDRRQSGFGNYAKAAFL
jgi:DNA-binding GntR family transcriptional regulator